MAEKSLNFNDRQRADRGFEFGRGRNNKTVITKASARSRIVDSADDVLLSLTASDRSSPRPPLVKNAGLSAQIHPIDCPLCKQPVRVPTLEIVTDHYRVTPLEAKILSAVWRGRGLPVSTERIFDSMYADDPDGGPSPTRMYAAFKVSLCHLRKRLEGSGISIINAGYRRGYRLVFGDA